MKNYWKSGDPYIWMTGAALMCSLLIVGGLLLLIMVNGLGFFWPSDVALVELKNGESYLGEIKDREKIPYPEDKQAQAYRIQLKIGNRDFYGLDFKWIDESEIESIKYPADAVALERFEWGNFYGFLKDVQIGDRVVAQGKENSYEALKSVLPHSHKTKSQIKKIQKDEIGDINYQMERARLKIRGIEEKDGDTEEAARKIAAINEEIETFNSQYQVKEKELISLYAELKKDTVVIETVEGREKTIEVGGIVRVYRPNTMSAISKAIFYVKKGAEFLWDDPRESNTEGGVFPAIFGTVLMVIIMAIAVSPFGVLAAIYLREYAKQGTFVRIVRICINNLAGVPSIVFGVFGVGFFIYGIGGNIDQFFFSDALPTATYGTGGILWASLTLALLTLPVVIVASEEGLASVPTNIRNGSIALGATKYETLTKVVLPTAMPGILTGLILAIARATGEVAPLMITGVVKLAATLPVDGRFPFIHLERKFMHLGFHIYDVGFQSPNVEAAKPMVYATTLLLIVIVILLNITAIIVRNRLRKKYFVGEF